MDAIVDIFVGVFQGLETIFFLLGIGIPLLCLILMVVMSLISSYGKLYRTGVKKVMDYLEKNPDDKDITECLKYLPEEPRNSLKTFMRFRKGRPSEHFSIEASVDSPLKRGWTDTLARIAAMGGGVFAILYLAATSLGEQYIMEGQYFSFQPTGKHLAAIGGILLVTWVSNLVLTLGSKLGYTATLKAHKNLMELLDNSFSNFAPPPQGKAQPQKQQAQQGQQAQQPRQPQQQAQPQQSAPPPQQPVQQQQQRPPQQQPMQPPPQQPMQQPQQQPMQPQQPMQQPQQQPMQQQPVQQQQASQGSEVDKLLAKVATFASGEASIAEMKEVAVKLQAEKAKLENKTPEAQKRINDGLTMLLRAMQAKPK